MKATGTRFKIMPLLYLLTFGLAGLALVVFARQPRSELAPWYIIASLGFWFVGLVLYHASDSTEAQGPHPGTDFEFRTSKFRLEGEAGWEKGQVGKLAAHLGARLKERGLTVVEPEFCENQQRWTLQVMDGQGELSVWLALCNGRDDHYFGYITFGPRAVPRTFGNGFGIFRKRRSSASRGAISGLAVALDEVLKAEGDVQDVQWWVDQDWD